MASTIQNTLIDRGVDVVMKRVPKLAHISAAKGFKKDFDAIEAWVRGYLQRLSLSYDERVAPRAHRWNKQAGYGLQSFSLPVLRDGEKPTSEGRLITELSNVHHRAPTIGLEAPGMLGKPGILGEARFPVLKSYAERITGLSSGIHMQSGGTGPVDVLNQGEQIVVTGPEVVRTYLELQDCPSAMQRQITREQVTGAYACEFLLTPAKKAQVFWEMI